MGYEIIKRLMKKETNNLRKACFKYKRKKLLEKHVLVKVVELQEFKESSYTPIYHEEQTQSVKLPS